MQHSMPAGSEMRKESDFLCDSRDGYSVRLPHVVCVGTVRKACAKTLSGEISGGFTVV